VTPRRPLGIRARLTLWHVGAMVIVLGVYAAGVFAFVGRSLSHALDARLRGDYTWAAEMWDQRPDGTLTWFDHDAGDEDNPWLQVWTADGDLLFRTAVAKRNPLPDSRALAANAHGGIESVSDLGTTFRVLSRQSTIGGRQVVIQVARSEAPMRRELGELTMFLAIGLPFGVAAAGLGGYALARRALSPIDRMAARARLITTARLSDRLPVDNPTDELGKLASVFNETLERLETSFEQMRRFTADVSHELRTPLTAIRTVGEVGLREHREGGAYRRIIGSMLEEVDRLTLLVERLLVLSRADSGRTHLAVGIVDLPDLVNEVAAHLGVLAEDKGQTLAVDCEAARCAADRVVLRQAVINLVDNAIKYAPAGSRIRIATRETPGAAVLEVRDAGPGIDAERRARIFDRYYRGSVAGDRGGLGLGLSISKWAVEVNKGQLSWERSPEGGSTFRITLPHAQPEVLAAAG
jgi:heavy metal sensor kinase